MLSLALLLLWSACSSPSIITTWKDHSLVQRNYQKILVIGIIGDSTAGLRDSIETYFVSNLKALGYNAVSSFSEFGAGELRGLEQEKTYIKLCNKGIDAVITVALLNKQKERRQAPATGVYYTGVYYYNRIWNYRAIQADSSASTGTEGSQQFFWETILFDLATLTPRYSARTKSFNPASEQLMAPKYGKMLVAHMVKTKALFKQPVAKQQPLKAF